MAKRRRVQDLTVAFAEKLILNGAQDLPELEWALQQLREDILDKINLGDELKGKDSSNGKKLERISIRELVRFINTGVLPGSCDRLIAAKALLCARIASSTDRECPICMEVVSVSATPCKQVICEDCRSTMTLCYFCKDEACNKPS